MRWPKMVINQGGGAGWEVDAEKRLMPQWASEELYNQLQFFNRLWRDGLMSPGPSWIRARSKAIWRPASTRSWPATADTRAPAIGII